MKKLLMVALLSAALSGVAEAKKPVSFGVFYSSLSPYGEWIQMDVGYRWRPLHVSQGWRPYLYGQWVWSGYGWYWASSEPFGWATFHYGRWIYDDYYGWIWQPDDQWCPAWVEWRYDDDYVGWAPLTPYAAFDVSYGVRYTNRWVAPVHYWNFVPCRDFTSGRVVEYVQPIEQSRRIYGSTRAGAGIRVNDHRVVNGGVDVRFVEQRANTRINRVELVSHDRPDAERVVRGSGSDRVEAYRPRLDRDTRGESDRPRDFRVDERRHEAVQGGATENHDGRVENPRSNPRMFGPDAGRQPNAPGRVNDAARQPNANAPGRINADRRRDQREQPQEQRQQPQDQRQRVQDQQRMQDQRQRIQDQQQRREQDRREVFQRQQQRSQDARQQHDQRVERRQQQNDRPRIQQERRPPPERPQ